MARPSDLTPETKAEAIKLAKAGVPKVIIADAIGVNRQTLFNWLLYGNPEWEPKEGQYCPADRTPFFEFYDEFTRARVKPVILCEATWLAAVHKGDAQAAERWLKLHEPSLYREQQDVNVTVQGAKELDAIAEYQQAIREIMPDDESA